MSQEEQQQKFSEDKDMQFFGPVILVKYMSDNKQGHLFWVNDSSKLPENAAGIRIPADSPLHTLLAYAFDKRKPIKVAPIHRWWGPEGKLFWTIRAATCE